MTAFFTTMSHETYVIRKTLDLYASDIGSRESQIGLMFKAFDYEKAHWRSHCPISRARKERHTKKHIKKILCVRQSL